MKQFLLVLSIAIATTLFLTACDKPPSSQDIQKQKQQEEADKKAIDGKFKKSDNKSY
jgi:hypothetical protein